jgi:hypothetical protein
VRDEFGTIGEMESALKLIPARTELLTIGGAGHELISTGNRRLLPAQVVTAFLSAAVDRDV